MPEIRVVTDSGADLTKAEAQELAVTVVPLVVTFGQETYRDGELGAEIFWQKAQHEHPKSSQPPVGAFEQVFAQLVDQQAEVVCITLTAKHSGTYNAAWTAAQHFGDRVTVYDSQSVSWGQKFQVEAAVKAARQGETVAGILAILKEMQSRIHLFAIIDTIEYLERGGRVASILAFIKQVVRIFNVKPMLTIRAGEVRLLGMAHSFARGLARIERELLALGPLERLGIIHIRNLTAAQKLAASLASKLSLPHIPIIETGVALSTHGGPGVVGAVALCRAAAPR